MGARQTQLSAPTDVTIPFVAPSCCAISASHCKSIYHARTFRWEKKHNKKWLTYSTKEGQRQNRPICYKKKNLIGRSLLSSVSSQAQKRQRAAQLTIQAQNALCRPKRFFISLGPPLKSDGAHSPDPQNDNAHHQL